MFDILAHTYMTATRMDTYLEQEFMHKNPRIAQRLRYIHGLDTPHPSLTRRLRGRIGMDGPIAQARQPCRGAALSRAAVKRLGIALRRAGEWLEQAATPVHQGMTAKA